MSEQFVRMPVAVIDHSDLDAHELLVYIALLRFRDHKTGVCFPGHATLADLARLSVASVQRAISRLEKKGIVKVERVKAVGSKTNEPNRYTVGLLSGDPRDYFGRSAMGKRVPKRKLSPATRERMSDAVRQKGGGSELQGEGSESLPSAGLRSSGDSELMGNDSELLQVMAPSHSNKLQLNKLHEQAITPAFRESVPVHFSSSDYEPATDGQIVYLKDLVTMLMYEHGGGLPDELLLARWRKLSRVEAHEQIQAYRRELGDPGEREYPESGSLEHEGLSDAGKEFADSGGRPDSVSWPWLDKEIGA